MSELTDEQKKEEIQSLILLKNKYYIRHIRYEMLQQQERFKEQIALIDFSFMFKELEEEQRGVIGYYIGTDTK